jgi:hypothetical protein
MTTTRIIQREFVVQPGDDTLPAVTLDFAWSSFMNTYAVWPAGAGDSVIIRRSISLQAGYYYVTGTVDNFGSVNINGAYNITLYNFREGISRTEIRNNTRVYHPGGPMAITISATNTGGPRGVAVTISREIVVNPYALAGFLIKEVRIGDLVWSTRSPGTATIGRYQVTMPFRASITAHAWGAGGGGGGLDPEGGVGSPGLYNVTTFQVERGDTLEVFVGTAGQFGRTTPGVGGSPGGPGGNSRLNINGDSTRSFSGGTGGDAGLRGWSGGGGGGGGASGVLVNNSPVLVAGGGGGGSGGGSYRDPNAGRQQGSIFNNATGAAGNDYRGENGETKGNPDGGGGGGGGGGYPGGQGGAVHPGDTPGFAGQCGGNFPVFAPTTGTGTAYYKAGFGGGASYSASGQNGRVFLLIEPISLVSVKVAGEWEQVQDAFVKVSGTWRDIDTIYIKINDAWRELNGAGQGDITLAGNTQSYGTSTRSFS